MSNKPRITDHNGRLTSNNTNLNSILSIVNSLPPATGEGIVPTGTMDITENGKYDVTNYEYANVDIDVEEITLQEKTVTPTKSIQNITPDGGYDGLSKVSVNAIPNEYIIPTGSKTITTNGTHDVKNYANAVVNTPVPKTEQAKSVTITENGTTAVNPDSGKVLSKVTITTNVPIPEGYIKPSGSINISENGSYDVTQYSNVNVDVEGSGGGSDTTLEDGFITHTLAGDYSNNRVTTVGYGTFYNDTALTGIDMPNVTSIGNYAFSGCSNLVSVNMPLLTNAGGSSFNGFGVENVYFPELTTMGTYTFGNTAKTKTINLPKLKIVQSNGFRQNTGCTRLDLGECTNIYAYGLFNMYGLTTLIIRTNSVATLANTNAFSGCNALTGIYVPDTLVNSYKTATNWSTYADIIKPLSELEG